MTEITCEIRGDIAAGLMFDEFPDRAATRLRDTLDDLSEKLLSAILARVPHLAGALAAAFQRRVVARRDAIVAHVGVSSTDGRTAAKSLALEYGAHGIAAVREHASTLTDIFGRAIAPQAEIVRAYTRHANITEVDYARGPLHDMQDEIVAGMRNALGEAAKA